MHVINYAICHDLIFKSYFILNCPSENSSQKSLFSSQIWCDTVFFSLFMFYSLRHMLTQIFTKSKMFDLPGSLLVTLRGSFKIKNFKMRKKRFIHHDSASSTTTGIQRSITTLKRIINRKKFNEFPIRNYRAFQRSRFCLNLEK